MRPLAVAQHKTWQDDNRCINMTLRKELKRAAEGGGLCSLGFDLGDGFTGSPRHFCRT
ncbi:MAG: hypothetical protein ACREDV_07415 [Methylocella sp.]